MIGPDGEFRGASTSRRGLFVGGAVALFSGIVLTPTPRAAAAPPFRIATEQQHRNLSVSWGYPFSSRASRNLGVDGYPGDTYSGHSGVDYFTTPRVGTPIHAVAEGTVVEVSNPLDTERDLGQYVRLRHQSGMYSSYGHMTPGSTRVAVGQNIPRGFPLGSTGWSGRVVPKTPETAHLHLTIYSEPGSNPVIWNPLWLVENAPFPEKIPSGEDDDMPFLVQSDRGHIYTVGPRYMRHETAMADVTFLQTVYSRYVICRTPAQFRAVTNSLSIPADVPDSLLLNGGGGTYAP
ncbi:M23 family metallopeptidase [Microbacterium sp. CCNWLW134]|uniref:M23 family metallopeptidase n=1 Tax=Microbacterium sp. CCNWLW134 TaxID=3122064 RepID=UPI003010606F